MELNDGDGDDWEKEPWKKYQKQNEKKVYNKERKSLTSSTGEDEVDSSDLLLGTYHGVKVYIETHQGKHCMGQWPGYAKTGKQGPYFSVKMVTYTNQPLFHILCNSDTFRMAITGPDASGLLFFNFGDTVCGTNSQTSCQLQWHRRGNDIIIHGCPDPKGKTAGFINIKSLK
jgi:hypothetical protein